MKTLLKQVDECTELYRDDRTVLPGLKMDTQATVTASTPILMQPEA